MASKHSIEEIKKGIEKHLGEDIIVKANKGRKKIVVREGVLEDAYSDVFVVRLKSNYDTSTRVSFSYADILTATVQLKLVRNAELTDKKEVS